MLFKRVVLDECSGGMLPFRTAGRLIDFSPGDRMSGRSSRLAMIVLFPMVVFAIQLALLLRLDAAQPVDSLNCDASHPTW